MPRVEELHALPGMGRGAVAGDVREEEMFDESAPNRTKAQRNAGQRGLYEEMNRPTTTNPPER